MPAMSGVRGPNRSRFWKPRSIEGVSLMKADFTTRGFAPHWHEAFVIGITVDGGSEIKSQGRVETAEPGALFVFNPGEPHAGWMGASARWRYRSLYLTRKAIDAATSAAGAQTLPGFTRSRLDDPALSALFADLHRALETGDDPLLQQELMVRGFSLLLDRHGERPVPAMKRDAVFARKVMDWMRDRHAETIRLDDIAAAFGVNPFTLISIFRKTVGMTPYACLIQIRLNAACRMLRLGARPADAAVAAGFYDQSALGRHFRKCYGITPAQFASAVRH
jgi:AraC-like DNA-binding protein